MLIIAQEIEAVPLYQGWINLVLIWIGFAALIGLIAGALAPGGDVRRSVSTLLIGLAGAVLGPLAIDRFFQIENFNPISFYGFLPGVAISFVLFIIVRSATISYRVYSDQLEQSRRRKTRPVKKRKRQHRVSYIYDDDDL